MLKAIRITLQIPKNTTEIIDQVNNRLAKNKKDLDAQIKAKKDKEKLAKKPLLSPKTELKQALK